MADLARIDTIAQAIGIDLERRLNLPKAGPLVFRVEDHANGGLVVLVALTRDWSRTPSDQIKGDGTAILFRVADRKDQLAQHFRQKDLLYVTFTPKVGGPSQVLKVRDIVWPKEGAARVYEVWCQTTQRGYKTFIDAL